jgi:hypothetical protein
VAAAALAEISDKKVKTKLDLEMQIMLTPLLMYKKLEGAP